MNCTPERPSNVPLDAHWIEEEQEWEHSPLADSQAKQGLVRYWRRDGSLKLECQFRDGIPHGPYQRFHENGSVAQNGQFHNGRLHSTCTWYNTSGQSTSESSQRNETSEHVYRTEIDYEYGKIMATRFFNRAGDRICSDGSAFPSIPQQVPAHAEFRPDSRTWCYGPLDEQNLRVGKWMVWSEGGELLETTDFQNGVPHGSHFEQIIDSQRFRVPQISTVQGNFQEGQAVGEWVWLDSQENIRHQIDFGPLRDETSQLSLDIFSDARKTGTEWETIAHSFAREGLLAEALCAFARAAANTTNIDGFLHFIEQHSPPLTSYREQKFAISLPEKECTPVRVLGNELVRGEKIAYLLRSMALTLHSVQRNRAALDYVNTAILLEPFSKEILSTRATILLSLGLDQHAAIDAQDIASALPQEATFLQGYAKILFPIFDFWPLSEQPQTNFEGLPESPSQPLDAIQRVVQKYATRLMLIRERVRSFAYPTVRWMIPDLSFLLTDGPVLLDRCTVEISFIGEESTRPVEIDETLDVARWDLPSLMSQARYEWNALTWLCWSVGLTDVAMPYTISAPGEFGLAAGMSAERLWICRDTIQNRSREAKASGFIWEGLPLEELDESLLRIAESQYAEMQAMFKWLSFIENQSPWQEDLRES